MTDSVMWCGCNEFLLQYVEEFEEAKKKNEITKFFDKYKLKWCCRSLLISRITILDQVRN